MTGEMSPNNLANSHLIHISFIIRSIRNLETEHLKMGGHKVRKSLDALDASRSESWR